MSHKKPRPAAVPAKAAVPVPADDPVRPWLLAGMVMLCVARPLLPSEGTITSSDALLFVFLPLVLAAAWALRALMRPGTVSRFGAIDLAVFALVAWYAVAAFIATRIGAPRPAINAAWQWVALAAIFCLLRQLIADAREVRAIAAVMVALAVTMSVLGFHQFFYSIPRDQARYRADPEAALKEAHVTAPPGSRQRVLFEQRVNSSEPMATFALANSLAGFLVPWFVVALGICAMAGVLRARDLRLWLPAALCALVIFACLVLTKSRAGLLAGGAGATALVLWTVVQGAQLSRKVLLAATALAGALVMAAVGVGALDREVLSEAGKSLGYRLQYWQATAALIKDHPLAGCGPGQFQGFYTAYMLPDASETVADPHNFLLEVCATAGLPAGVALLLVIVLIGWRALRPGSHALPEGAEGGAAHHVYAGAVAGFVLALMIGPLATVPLGLPAFAGGLLTAAVAVALLNAWVRRGRITPGVLAIAAGALLINLLAAGGIGFAAVAGSLWLLGALCVTPTERAKPLPTSFAALLFALTAGLGLAFYFTVYSPVLACNAELDLADVEAGRAEAHLRSAIAADPLNVEPHKRLALLEWTHWQQHPSPAAFERFVQEMDETAKLDPHSAPLAELKGDVCLEVHRRTNDEEPLHQAIEAYRRAAELYPNSGMIHAKLALALRESGDATQSAQEAAEALRLDGLTPHADQKLPQELRTQLQPAAVDGRE